LIHFDVMAGLDPAIHVLTTSLWGKTWIRGSSPRMTKNFMSNTKGRFPDFLAPNLRLVFVGTAVSHRSTTEEFQNKNAREGFLRRGRFQFR
jgi:hypothetical protein